VLEIVDSRAFSWRAWRVEGCQDICPPYYQGLQYRWWKKDLYPRLYQQAMEYVRHVPNWPADVPFVWTGPVTESNVITSEDVDAFQKLLHGRPLLYFDNTWHYHQPLANFHAQYPKDFVNRCAGSIAFLHINGVTPIGRYFAATVMDYYWNPNAFESKRAWHAAVGQFLSPDALPAAERFYQLRGEDYYDRWSRGVPLKAFAQVLRELEATGKVGVSW
jgi:hypothetical protein